jgi:hypothetical protein
VNQGSAVFNKRFGAWNFLWHENGHRRSNVIGTEPQFPTKAAAWRAAGALQRQLEQTTNADETALTVRDLVERYQAERMPRRAITSRDTTLG